MKVTMEDGATFEGDTAAEVVSQMRRDDWSAPPKKGEYMVEVAERVRMMTERQVRATNPEAFLLDLERARLCRVEYLTPEQARRFAALAAETMEEDAGDDTHGGGMGTP